MALTQFVVAVLMTVVAAPNASAQECLVTNVESRLSGHVAMMPFNIFRDQYGTGSISLGERHVRRAS